MKLLDGIGGKEFVGAADGAENKSSGELLGKALGAGAGGADVNTGVDELNGSNEFVLVGADTKGSNKSTGLAATGAGAGAAGADTNSESPNRSTSAGAAAGAFDDDDFLIDTFSFPPVLFSGAAAAFEREGTLIFSSSST